MHRLSSGRTTWHITFGTYGARLHGDERPTVDRRSNAPGEAFVEYDPDLRGAKQGRMRAAAVQLTLDQQRFIQEHMPHICERGGWTLRISAAVADHVHVLLDAAPAIHGEKVRRLVKRWLTQLLNQHWPTPAGGRWWAEQGSNRAVDTETYLNRAYEYIERQRA